MVEPSNGPPADPVRPIPVTLPLPEAPTRFSPLLLADELGLPLSGDIPTARWEEGERTILRRFLPGAGRWRRSLLPVNDGAEGPFYARIVRAEPEGSVEEDLDQLRYQRSLSAEGVQETLIVERTPVPPDTVALIRRQRGPLVPPAFAALVGPGSLPAPTGEHEIQLREPSSVQVLLVGGPPPANEALVDLAGRRLLLPRERIFALPCHAILASPPPEEQTDTTIPLVITAVRDGEATVVTEEGSRKLPLASLSPVRMEGGELLGDLPGESWLWLSEEPSEGRRIYLEQPVRLRGLALPAGLVLALSAEGAVAAVQVEEPIFLGERRLAPGTQLLVGDSCTFRESPLAQPQLCLDVVEGRLLPR